jgi:hypothetical protein
MALHAEFSIADLSALLNPHGGRLMGALSLKGYLDESGKDTTEHNALAICGYICTVEGWKDFERSGLLPSLITMPPICT